MTRPKCKDCKERHMGYHSTCENYIEWAKQREAERAAMHKDMDIKNTIYEVTKGHAYKTIYRKNHRKV